MEDSIYDKGLIFVYIGKLLHVCSWIVHCLLDCCLCICQSTGNSLNTQFLSGADMCLGEALYSTLQTVEDCEIKVFDCCEDVIGARQIRSPVKMLQSPLKVLDIQQHSKMKDAKTMLTCTCTCKTCIIHYKTTQKSELRQVCNFASVASYCLILLKTEFHCIY